MSGAVEEFLPWLPFDHFERYRLTGTIASLLKGEGVKWRILDVGGHLGTLKHFLRDDIVFIADPKLPPEFAYRQDVPFACDAYVRAAGEALPFRDGGFDLVCAHDTLEHVPARERDAFLRDLVRVTGRFLVLNGPLHSEATAAAEERIARMWVEGLGATEHALDEHLRFGLPTRQLVEDALTALEMPFVAIPNGRLTVWLAMMALKTLLMGLPDAEEAHAALDRAFNVTIAEQDLGAPSYRLAFLAARDPGDRATIDRVREAFAAPVGNRSVEPNEAVYELIDALQANVVRVRGIIEDLRSDQDRLNDLARRQGRRIEELEARPDGGDDRRG